MRVPSDAAAGVVVSDPIPAGTTGSETEADCAISAGAFTCTTTAPIAAGGSKAYQLTLNVSSGYSGTSLTNTATITSVPAGTNDPDSSDYSASDTDAVTKSADLSVTKADSPDPVLAGNHLVYTIVVLNAGPSDAAGVSLSDTLPVELTGETFCEGAACDPSAGGAWTGSTSLGTIAAGGSKTVKIRAKVESRRRRGRRCSRTRRV